MGKHSLFFTLFLFIAACGGSKPKDKASPPTPASDETLKLEGQWKVEEAVCGGQPDRSGKEIRLGFDENGFAFRYLVDEVDDQHRCVTIRMYQRAQIVESVNSTEPRNSSGTYDFYLRAVRHACQYIRDGKLEEATYFDKTDETIPDEYFQVKFRFIDANTLELSSEAFPTCPNKSLRIAYRKA